MKRIAVLTSSRADYGIYLPLLKALKENSSFRLEIIVFGTHLSPFHGFTIDQILKDGFEPTYQIESLIAGDSPNAISSAMALTSLKFADFWRDHQKDFDLVFCLGDRYEMFAAVIAGIPFNILFAHLHGGEITLGSIDNFFRHSITLAAKYHFVSCEAHAKKVAELTESKDNIFNVGSLSLDNLTTISLLSIEEFLDHFGIDLSHPTILVTLHPETISPLKNEENVNELAEVLLEIEEYQVLVSLPNADTNGSLIRNKFLNLSRKNHARIHCYENLGTQGYFTALKYCSFLLGNSSSGIIEAATLGKWIINIGNRQEGRKQSQNTYNVPFNKKDILKAIENIENDPVYIGRNIYSKKNTAKNICSILNTIL